MGKRFVLGEIDRNKPVHFVGIGGAGMSGIATVLLEMGFPVEGSDIKDSPNVRRLRESGAVIGIGHREENLGEAAVVVRSSAIAEGNPELVEAARREIPVISRAEMLSGIMSTRTGIAIAGTHGKTTTSSLVAQMLLGCGVDPSFLIGGELNEIGGNAHYGQGTFLVAEADESDGSLLFLEPYAAVLTNVDGDHLDYYDDLDHTARVFGEFLRLLPADGFAVVCGDDGPALEVASVFKEEGGRVLLYGRSADFDYSFVDLSAGANGSDFTVFFHKEELGRVSTRIPGLHNVYNAIAALAVGHQLGMPVDDAIEGISNFKGVRRRFELVGEAGGVTVIDDYAHHPTEVLAVTVMAGEIASGRVVVVFQPHRYTRTRLLYRDFGGCFASVDLVFITDVYGAGEDPEPGVTGELVADCIRETEPGKEIVYVPGRADLAREVAARLAPGDMVITMGAGDVTLCSHELIEFLEERDR